LSNKIKLKRSSSPSSVPQLVDLSLGELAVNTFDGKIFFKKDDGSESIGSIVTTNAQITGSIELIGDVTASSFLGSNAELNSLSVTDNIITNAVTASSFKLTGGVGDQGTFAWNPTDTTVDLKLNNVTLQLGQELHYNVINQTGTQINNGEVVYVVGVSSDKLSVAPYSASMDVGADLVLGLATENIADASAGFVTKFGVVRDINTSAFTVGTPLWSSTGSSGYTDISPIPPSHNIFLGFVATQDATAGSIQVNTLHQRNASEIKTNLSGSTLISTNIQAALLELDSTKASVDSLSSNITLYPTTGSSPIPTYFRMVTSVSDVDYNTTEVNVDTGEINTTSQLIASLASDEGIFVGNPGAITITTIGSVRRSGGGNKGKAQFYFELYQSSSLGEELITTSNLTPEVTSETYVQFNSYALLNNGDWTENDRIVIKYYGNDTTISGGSGEFQFLFGGATPVRTLLPVPVSVIPSTNASGILVDTSNFNNILDGDDSNVQAALDTLDDHSHTLQEITSAGNITTGRIIAGNLTVDTNVLYTTSSNVGIGTTTPETKLHIVGNVSASNFETIGYVSASAFSGPLFGNASTANTASYVTPLIQNVQITGSLNLNGSMHTTNAVTSSLFLINNDSPSSDIFLVKVGGNPKIKINQQGTFVINESATLPTPETGAIVVSGSNFFVYL
jgi:hypothetical protein